MTARSSGRGRRRHGRAIVLSAVAVAAVVVGIVGSRAHAQTPRPRPSPTASPRTPPAPQPSASPRPPSPSPLTSNRPISDSIERVIDQMEEQRHDPCQMAAAEGRPCFPVSVELKGPEYSVAEEFRNSIRGLASDRSAVPNPGGALTAKEIDEQHRRQEGRLESPSYPMASISFDAKCVGRAILRQARGEGTVFYLYQVRDRLGEFPVLREQPYDEATLARMPGNAVTFLGKFDGECNAVAAYRKALRESPSRYAAPGLDRSPTPSPSPTPLP